MAQTHHVFVYGTLLRGLANHHWLRGASFVREDATVAPFTLVDLGEYPAVLDRPGGPVIGEVWCVDDRGLEHLDELEDYPTLYTRRREPTAGAGQGETAWIYILNGEPNQHGMHGVTIPDGSYRAHLARKRERPTP